MNKSQDTQTKDKHTKQKAQETIIAMFDKIAKDYDKTNRILSLGIDVSWRKDAVKKAYKARNTRDIGRIVDVACGSGDMIKHWHSYALESNIVVREIIGIDPSQEMLKIAQNKLQAIDESSAKTDSKISLHLGEAKDLSTLESQSVDILSISYGLRNVLEYEQALHEFARVLKPEGIVVVLDFFKKSSPSLLDRIIGIYTKHILPCIGYLISRNYAAYKYLPDSMEEFITPNELALALEKVGIQPLEISSYSVGISYLVLGQKPCDKADKR